MDLKEYVGLVSENVRLDGLVEKIDRTSVIAFEQAVFVSRASPVKRKPR